MISAEELYKLKWMFLDIEIPHFKRENGQITWVGVTYIQNGKIIRKIHTIHDAGASEINGYQMIKYENSSALVDGLTKEIQEENPDGVSAFNAPFDFIKLKESEDDAFLIGGDKSSPKQKVTLENFKRLVVDDRLLIDYMRLLGKMLYKYNPNAKLPMVSGHEKSISYGEMEKLEDECFLLHQNAARTIAEYLSGDVSCLEQMHMSKLTRKALEVIIKICEFYDVGIERVAHSPNCINDVQNRGFFYTLGTHREEVPPHQRTAKMEQLREKARERFMETIIQKFIGKPESKGRFENVIKADIPIGFFMRELVEKRFPDAHKLYEYAIENRDDKPVLFLCEQFQKEFARWMIEDYGAYLGEINQFKSLLKKRKLAHEDFEEVYSGLRKHLGKISKGSLINLDQAKLKAETLRNHAAPELRDFLRSKCMKFSDFAELANQRVMIKRKGVHVIGNYAVYPREFFEDDIDEMRMYYRKPLVIEDVLNEKFEKMKKFFREKGLEIIGQEGSYVYLRGNADSIKAMDGPGAKAIKLDVIPNVYIADKIYYKKHGFLHHQKITADSEDSDNNTCLLAGRFFGSIINLLLEGKSAEAVKTFQETYWSIKSGQSAPEISDLVYKNKSKKRYSVFANNYNSGDGLVYYVESERFIPLEETEKSVKLKNGKTVKRKAMAQRQTEIDENGLRYFIDSSGGAKPKDIRVYVGMPPSIKPNINKYLEMLSERARIILAPVCPDYSLKKSGKIAKQDKNQMQMGV